MQLNRADDAEKKTVSRRLANKSVFACAKLEVLQDVRDHVLDIQLSELDGTEFEVEIERCAGGNVTDDPFFVCYYVDLELCGVLGLELDEVLVFVYQKHGVNERKDES